MPIPNDPTTPPAHPVLLKVRQIGKTFGATRALEAVDLDIAAGEAHALLGENGAGKSTLLKILAGALRPDSGTIVLDGTEVDFATPHAAIAQGIATIYQEFSLFPNLSVAENIAVGRLPRTASRRVDWSALQRRAQAVIDRLGLTLDPQRIAASLSVAEQQLTEIARALSLEARVIIMDEPTATLSANEVQRLQALIAELTANGTAVVFVTHRLDEVKAFCDRYTVLRDGAKVGSGRVSDVSIDDLVQQMIGRPLASTSKLADERQRPLAGPPALEIRSLSTSGRTPGGRRSALHDISLTAHGGEIVGIAGLVGAGRSELAHAVFGADPMLRGEIRVDGELVQLRSPRDAMRAGIGLVPEDRKRQGLFPRLPITDNFAMASLRRLAGRLGFIDGTRLRAELAHFTASFGIRMADAQQAIAALSGGNQQKVIIARWLARRPRVLIVDEPTRGIDVGAKAEVHHLLRALADSGVAVIVIAADLTELTALADRIVTLRGGRINGSFAASTRGANDAALIMRAINTPSAPGAAHDNPSTRADRLAA